MKTLIKALILVAAATSAQAQETPAKPEVKTWNPKIAVIDMARISSESLLGKGYAQQLETLRNEIEAEQKKKQSDLEKMDAALKALQDEIDKQQSVLSAEALDRKRQDLVRKNRERQAFLEDGQQDLQRLRQRAEQRAQQLNGEFQVRIKPHVEAVAKEKGIDILLDSQVALTVSSRFDISQDVIVRADDAERAAKAKPASPAPAQSPAPAPTPSPTPKP
jgi:Skp family chaperone for outer membrane proteins